MTTYVALLRGINVGGKNLIKMPALKASFEANGFQYVATYIQSGNVIFGSPETRPAELTRRIETMLAAAFDTPAGTARSTRKKAADKFSRELDALAREVNKNWKTNRDAAGAVREQRRG